MPNTCRFPKHLPISMPGDLCMPNTFEMPCWAILWPLAAQCSVFCGLKDQGNGAPEVASVRKIFAAPSSITV